MMYVEQEQRHLEELNLRLQQYENARRLTASIRSIAGTQAWAPLKADLEKARIIALEQMAVKGTSDVDRRELAAEARVLGWLSDRPTVAERELDGLDSAIAELKVELKTLSRRLPQAPSERRT